MNNRHEVTVDKTTDYKTLHYIPANHVFANYMVSGAEGARQHIKKEALRMKGQIKNDPVMNRWVEWYEKTALALIVDMENGIPIHQTYPPFCP